jgi:hypothetical protein
VAGQTLKSGQTKGSEGTDQGLSVGRAARQVSLVRTLSLDFWNRGENEPGALQPRQDERIREDIGGGGINNDACTSPYPRIHERAAFCGQRDLAALVVKDVEMES